MPRKHRSTKNEKTSLGKVVFVFDGHYAFEQQLHLAQYMLEMGVNDLSFLIISELNRKYIFQLDQTGIPYIELFDSVNLHSKNNAKPQTENVLLRPGRNFGKIAANGVFFNLISLPWESIRSLKRVLQRVLHLRKRRLKAETAFRELKPSCVITSQERAPDFLPIMAACKRTKLPVVLLPAHALCNADGGAVMRFKQGKWDLFAGLNTGAPLFPSLNWIAPLLNRIIAVISPGQVYASRYGRLLIWPAEEILALAVSGMLPPNAWHHGTRFSDYVILSGNDEKEVCVNAGIPSEKLRMLGSPSLDSVYETFQSRRGEKASFLRDHRLIASKPVLILAIPPLYEHEMLGCAEHFNDMRRIVSSSALFGFGVVVSLHPKMRPEDYRWITEEYGIEVTGRSLKDILAHADVFVGAAYTSTIRWALSLGIFTINLDFWGLEESTYRDIVDYPTVRTFEAFEARMGKYSPLNPVDGNGRIPMGLIADGKFKERFLQFLKPILSTGEVDGG